MNNTVGTQRSYSKLDAEAVQEIRSAFKQRRALLNHISANLSTKALAKKYGVVECTVEAVATGRTWGHV
jgi:hypothetical protein